MEVFFHGLQPGCSEKRLTKYLKGVFAEFNISKEEFVCEKRNSKKIASATILDAQKAQSFLTSYGNRRGALYLDGPFACNISKHSVDKFKIKSLEKKVKDSQGKLPQPQLDPDLKTFLATSVGCGNWVHTDNRLRFVELYKAARNTKVFFGKTEITLVQPVEIGSDRAQWIVITYSSIQSITTSNEQEDSLLLTLDRAPKFYDPPPPQTLSYSFRMMGIDLPQYQQDNKQIRTPAMDLGHSSFVESCMVYEISLAPTHLPKIRKLLRKDHRLPGLNTWHFSKEISTDQFYTAMSSLRQQLANAKLSFAVKFQLQRLAQNSYLIPELVEGLIATMQDVEKEVGMEKSVRCVQQLARTLPFAGPEADGRVFKLDSLKRSLKFPEEVTDEYDLSAFELARKHQHLVLVHRVRVTPAGIYLHGPYAEAKNGVLEKYRDHSLNHFLRVSFEDEDGEALKFEPQIDLSKIHKRRFKGVLDNAIDIAGRRFAFLGFSHSSLRESSCWFLAPFMYNDTPLYSQNLIFQLGDFSHIRSPAKCGARIGQAFTDLNDNVFIPSSAVMRVPDVERNGRCFSDGCSTASLEVFEKLWQRMRPGTFKPTTFQIRYGGVKGVISLDRSLQGMVLKVRPSQEKFKSSTQMLGVCGAAKRTLPFYLNRPMIKILEDLGIEQSVFMDLQDAAVRQLRLITSSATTAATFIEIHEIGGAANLPWFFRELYYLGIDVLQDSFLWSAAELVIILRLREIKYKSRIPIDPEAGVTLFGIMDETNTLEEGQIYVTVNEGRVITGRVAITRSPAMHPGDIQSALAVDVPEGHPLRDLFNVVVFSQQGERDLPSKLSGGDLDGDLFNVIIDKRLQPTRYFSPADYARPEPIDLGRPVESRDISDFFINFMSSDQLGFIATRHLQTADQEPEGTLTNQCIKLAEMHSTAVDFSKTGIPVKMFDLPKLRSRYKPDFMASGPRMLMKAGVTSLESNLDAAFYLAEEDDVMSEMAELNKPAGFYESQKVLGHLYRKIDETKFLRDLQTGRDGIKNECAMTKLWQYVQQKSQGFQWTHLTAWAKDIRDQYNNQIIDMTFQYAIDPHKPLTEIEVFLGIVMGKDGGIPSKRAREAASSIREHFNDLVRYTTECILKGDEGKFSEEAYERSLACFAVSVLDEKDDEGEEEGGGSRAKKIRRMHSFKYLAGMVCLRQVNRVAKDGF